MRYCPHIINVVCKYLRQFVGARFGVATLPIYCYIEEGGGTWFIYAKLTIPEFPEIFPGIDLVSIIYVRYYSAMFIDEEHGKLKVVVDGG